MTILRTTACAFTSMIFTVTLMGFSASLPLTSLFGAVTGPAIGLSL